MSNFRESERPFASRLLAGVTFFSNELVIAMFRAVFKNLSQSVLRSRSNYLAAVNEWASFVDSVIIVRVASQASSEADSGYIFTRLARDVIGIPEERLMSPHAALECIHREPQQNIVFVDDFVGTGEQFVDMWKQIHELSDAFVSFESLALTSGAGRVGFYYIPLVCAERGRIYIAENCPQVKLLPAHVLMPSYSALATDSVIWRDDMAITGPRFIEDVSARAGLRDLDGDSGCWRGYRKLGLTLAFEHGVPDATLPIFTVANDHWKPLIRSASL
ncbi:hypothetical protein [Stenotrophomonas sp. TWI587]|uniref:phosphoribosyltransferase-like protein n=1 Tax=Stenotrophomonas sp. TWI587 TaxID=3136783 RepID=UPI00320A9E21